LTAPLGFPQTSTGQRDFVAVSIISSMHPSPPTGNEPEPVDAVLHAEPDLLVGLEAKESLRYLDRLLTSADPNVRSAHRHSFAVLDRFRDDAYATLTIGAEHPVDELAIARILLRSEASCFALRAVDERAIDRWPQSLEQVLPTNHALRPTMQPIATAGFLAAAALRSPQPEETIDQVLLPLFVAFSQAAEPFTNLQEATGDLHQLQTQADALGYSVFLAETRPGETPRAAVRARRYLETANVCLDDIHWRGYNDTNAGALRNAVTSADDTLAAARLRRLSVIPWEQQ
jgi:hypothetical protein